MTVETVSRQLDEDATEFAMSNRVKLFPLPYKLQFLSHFNKLLANEDKIMLMFPEYLALVNSRFDLLGPEFAKDFMYYVPRLDFCIPTSVLYSLNVLQVTRRSEFEQSRILFHKLKLVEDSDYCLLKTDSNPDLPSESAYHLTIQGLKKILHRTRGCWKLAEWLENLSEIAFSFQEYILLWQSHHHPCPLMLPCELLPSGKPKNTSPSEYIIS